MRDMLKKLQHFRRSEGGVAAVEFALILPVMLLVYIGANEASALISMDRRIDSAAATLGDLVSQSKEAISSDELTNYFRAADGIMQPFGTAADSLVQIVSLVYVDNNDRASVRWSQKNDGSAGHERNATLALPAEITNIARDNYVIVSEAQYDYLPLLGIVFNQPISLYSETFYLPRFGTEIALN